MTAKLIYLQIEEEIRRRIREGVYRAGGQLPTEKELVEEFGVSRLTIGKSLLNLVADGLITRTRGRGSFINPAAAGEGAGGNTPAAPGIFKFISPPASAGDEVLERNGILEGMRDAVHAAGYSVGIDFYNTLDEEHTLLSEFRRPLNDGFAVWPTNDRKSADQLRELQQAAFPFVQIDSFFAELNGDYVLTDNIIGAQLVVDHLFRLGHRRIAYLTVPVDRVSQAERLSGAIGALSRYGLNIANHLGIIPAHGQINPQNVKEQQYEFISRWVDAQLALPDPPTAIFCSNDTLAVSLGAILAERGCSVPGDISLAGFDNIAVSNWLPVPLTTVEHDFYRIGKLAGQILLARRTGQDALPCQYRVAPRLIVRKSTGEVSEK